MSMGIMNSVKRYAELTEIMDSVQQHGYIATFSETNGLNTFAYHHNRLALYTDDSTIVDTLYVELQVIPAYVTQSIINRRAHRVVYE